jgi:hypothetical protein
MAQNSSRISTALAILGLVVLAVGAVGHLAFGYPPLVRGIEAGLIGGAPGMSPSELKAVWVASSFLMLVTGTAPLLVLSSRLLFRRVASPSGLGAIGCAIAVCVFVGGMHPAVVIFGLSGLLFTVAAGLA